MDDDNHADHEASSSSSSSSSFLQQLVAQRTAFVQVKQEELTDDDFATTNTNTNDVYHDPDGHLCVVCMDNERSCLYVPCNHLAVCAECDAEFICLLYTSPSPRDLSTSRMPSSA